MPAATLIPASWPGRSLPKTRVWASDLPDPQVAPGETAVLNGFRIWPGVGVTTSSRRTVPDYPRARYYDPATGQFISRDPAVAMTREPYAYAYDNPLNMSDPSGLGPFDWALPGGGSLAGGGVAACIFGGCEAAVVAAPFVLAAGLGAAIGFEIAPTVSSGLDAADPYLVGAATWVGSNWLNAKKSRARDKERSTDKPSWAPEPMAGESGSEYARRACDDKYGPGNYKVGGGSEYSKLQKWLDRRGR